MSVNLIRQKCPDCGGTGVMREECIELGYVFRYRWGCICGDKGIEDTEQYARDAFLIHECGVTG